jgi:hypothetical protein
LTLRSLMSRVGSSRRKPRLTANPQSERSVASQLRAANGGSASSRASIHCGGNGAIGRSPFGGNRNRSRMPRLMRWVPGLFEVKNCCES